MKARVIQTVSEIMSVPVEKISDESSPDTIEAWDSLNHMNLVLALEEEFEVQFSDEKIVAMLSVGMIVAGLEELVG